MLAALGEAADEAVRPAAQAGAQVLYDQVKQNVQGLGRKTGRLDKAIYQVFEKSKAAPGKASYAVSWNAKTAPHGHLVEAGHIQRYLVLVGEDGRLRNAVRPEARGKRRPGRNASQAAKDAYYVPRPGGPIQIPPKAFIRRAASRFPEALDAVERTLFQRLAAVTKR